MTLKNYPPLLGLSGPAGSGKSSVAAYLAVNHGFHCLAFADPLKDLVQEAFQFFPVQVYGDQKEEIDHRFGKSPRWCLQALGTACREIWPDIWVWRLEDALRRYWQLHQPPVVVTDVRLRNEVQMLQRLGAKLLRLERPGYPGAANGIPDHISETDLNDFHGWDAILVNSGSLADLYSQVDYFLTAFAG